MPVAAIARCDQEPTRCVADETVAVPPRLQAPSSTVRCSDSKRSATARTQSAQQLHLVVVVGMGVLATAQFVPTAQATSALALYSVQECSSCDVPTEAQIPFCAEFVKYSSCRTKSSWSEMVGTSRLIASTEWVDSGKCMDGSDGLMLLLQDTAAQEEYAKLLNDSTAGFVAANGTCGSTLKHAECARIFNVCELGAPQSFCLDSCASVIATNCSSALPAESLSAAQVNFCGSATRPIFGVSDGGKCFDADYVGPKHSAWIVGFVIAVVFSFFASVGINLQKKALKQNELNAQEHNTEPTPVYRLPLWCLGFFLILAGSILDFVAFGLAPQSLLAPLAALTLVWNMVRPVVQSFLIPCAYIVHRCAGV